VIVGGHSHTLFGNQSASATVEYPLELESSAGEPLLIVQEGSTADYLGRLDVEFDADGVLADWNGDSIFLSQYITPDAEMDALVQELAVPLEEIRTRRVGDSSVALVGDRRVCRVEECNLGNLITDAMRNESGAQIAITNGGGIRADIDEGEVTLGEVLTVLPFGNLLAIVELRGADVIAALELGVSSITVTPEGVIARDGAAGRFPQVSGIAYTFDPTQEVGSRIVSVTLEDGSALDPEAVYTVVTNDFMRRGGDGYVMFAENAISFYDFGKPLDQVLADYIAANGPVAPELEGRITATVGYTE
jgi:5'-nucleotidase